MGPTDPVPGCVRIVASTALRRAGLERVLADAGVVAAREQCGGGKVTVRTTDDQPSGAAIELSIGADDIGLLLRSRPSWQEWVTVMRLVDTLLTKRASDA